MKYMNFSVPKIPNIDELSYLCCLEKTNRNNFLKTILYNMPLKQNTYYQHILKIVDSTTQFSQQKKTRDGQRHKWAKNGKIVQFIMPK